MRDLLQTGCAALGLDADEELIERLLAYAALLDDWNQRHNLVHYHSWEELATKHILDSLTWLEAIPAAGEAPRLIDLGSGAGLPGLILALARPDWQVTLVDSQQKRAAFLDAAVAELGLSTVTVSDQRAEALGRVAACRERYGLVTARRLAPLPVLLEYAAPLLATGGSAVLAKGEGLADELPAGRAAAALLGLGEVEQVAVATPWSPAARERVFCCVQKIGPTPAAYPRRVGIPTKRPLGS